jgi:hypothetical protein
VAAIERHFDQVRERLAGSLAGVAEQQDSAAQQPATGTS